MNTAGADFKKWNLPTGGSGVRPLILFPQEDSVDFYKKILNDTFNRYRDAERAKDTDLQSRLRGAVKKSNEDLRLMLLYEYESVLKNVVNDYIFNPDDVLDEPLLWDWKKMLRAPNAVSHMIYSLDLAGNTHKLNSQPLVYLLQNPSTGVGANLVQKFRSADGEDFYLRCMKYIWTRIKDFIEQDGGEFVCETLRDPVENTISETGIYAKEQMIKLKQVMSTAQLDQIQHHMGLQYKQDRANTITLPYNEGTIEMKVYDGMPDFGKVHPLLFPKQVTSIASAVFQEWKDASPGIFVSIIWRSRDNEQGEHYLYLTEYHHLKNHASLAHGWENKWHEKDLDGNPSFAQEELAVDSVRGQMGKWLINQALSENKLFQIILKRWVHSFGEAQLQEIYNLWGLLVQEQTMDFICSEVISPYCFYADNTAFVVLRLNTNHLFVRALLGLEEDEQNGWYVQALVLRYPIVHLNIDKIMIDIRYKYFTRNSPDIDKWKEWLHGTWHIPDTRHVRRDEDNPDEFQDIPQDDYDPLEWFQEENAYGRKVYSLRTLQSLPPHTTYAYLITHRPNMKEAFYLNNTESDPNIVYIYTHDISATWDYIQLFRINAEVMVSRLGHKRHNETFFHFKTHKVERGARGVHPFKMYLQTYPDLQEEWRRVWMDGWNNMDGWDRVEFKPEKPSPPPEQHRRHQQKRQNKPGEGRRAKRNKARARYQSVRPFNGVNVKRVASERRQNERFLMTMACYNFMPQ